MKLTNLADVLRDAGLTVVEEQGRDKATGRMISWKEFGRSGNSSYESGRPTTVMMHHTASHASIENDVAYCNHNSDIRPLANLLIARDGSVHVCAAGPTNTNGAGKDTWGGGVPDNQMNTHAIGVEICNTGSGETYPPAQQEAAFITAVALCRAYGIGHHNVRAHFEWAPTRKIDPRGPSQWSSGLNIKWDMDLFRSQVFVALLGDPDEGEEVVYSMKNASNQNGYHVSNLVQRIWISDSDYNAAKAAGAKYSYLGVVSADVIRAMGPSAPAE